LYAASLGFCWCVAVGIAWLGARAGAGPARAWTVAALTAAVFSLFAYRTIQYSRVWSSGEALWTYAIARSRDYRVRNNMAQIRLNQNRYEEAERLYRQGSGVENFVSYQGIATVCYDTHRYAEAEEAIDRALDVAKRKGGDYTDISEIEFTKGAIAWVQGKNQLAIDAWQEALRVNPRHAMAKQWLDTALGQTETPPATPGR
ncbi:MAG: tetratricopeptide repeat protein, partial [Candidatus Eiseniibacteriota bacterium]